MLIEETTAEAEGIRQNVFKTLLLIAPPQLDSDDEAKPLPQSLIDDYDLVENIYKAAYLYAVNECRRQSKKVKSETVDKSLYTERFNDAKSKFETLNDGTKAV